MSTPANNPNPPAKPAAPVNPAPPSIPAAERPKEVIVYGHSMLFYWWPVWVVGLLMGFLSLTFGSRVALLPKGSTYDKDSKTIKVAGELPSFGGKSVQLEGDQFREHMHADKNLGIIFTFVLLLVILITAVPLRGVNSLVLILFLAFLIVLFSALGWWDSILGFLGIISIHANAGFYMFFSVILGIIWALVFFIYDRTHYWRITPGQITHRYAMGGGERTYDTEGMAFSKLRDDLFRHMILGLGTGDLVMDPMKAGGASKDEMSIHNVLFISSKLRAIEDLIGRKLEAK